MAEVNTGGGDDKSGKRSKKVSTKIDMTPMVDLAFLLITFFMLTTSFSKPQTMEVNMPDKTKDNKEAPVKASNSITLILGEDNKVYWFQGEASEQPAVSVTDYSSGGIRKILFQKKKEIGEKKFVVVVKAMEKSKYRNMVDILDEMAITKTIFAIVKITPEDIALTQNI